MPDTSTPIANVLDAAGAPFWFNGQPQLILNPDAVAKKGGAVFKRGRLFNSGLPLAEGAPPPYTLQFNRTGTYKYICIVHPGMEGSVKVVGKKQKIPSASDVRKEAMRQEKSVLRRVQAASTGSGANQPANVIQAGNDTSTATVFKFFPAKATVKAGDTVTLRMPRTTGEVHTFSFGPIGTEQAPGYLLQIAAAGFQPAAGGHRGRPAHPGPERAAGQHPDPHGRDPARQRLLQHGRPRRRPGVAGDPEQPAGPLQHAGDVSLPLPDPPLHGGVGHGHRLTRAGAPGPGPGAPAAQR